MLNLLIISILLFLISFIVMFISTLLSKKTSLDREKISPFECGFNPLNHSRMPFSIRFFLIAIIFLIFDVEIALILPLTLIFKFCNMMSWTMSLFIFLVILLLGLFHEWNQGILNWSK